VDWLTTLLRRSFQFGEMGVRGFVGGGF